MTSPYQGQSTAKTIFLLTSMVGWLIVGASLIYLMPAAANMLQPSELTDTWMKTLAGSGYNPMLAIAGGGATFALTVAWNALWYAKFEHSQKVTDKPN
ncbi:MAG: hypothetical protein HC800_23540 [Phormidesmis sp. RL_2_1]|nr:hypothetical protein [Phormidesmis sp. RL_2_1]